MEQRCCEGRGACCSVVLMCTVEPRCYQARGITVMPLLFSDWSGCVNLLALIGPWRWKTKSMFRSKASSNFHSRCSQMLFLSSEASASAIKLFSTMTRERMCSALSSLKAKCLVWPLSPCVTVQVESLETSTPRNNTDMHSHWVMSFWKSVHIHSDKWQHIQVPSSVDAITQIITFVDVHINC